MKSVEAELLSRMGALLCDECGERLFDRYEFDGPLRFCDFAGTYAGGGLSCRKLYFVLGHDEWPGPRYGWLVDE